MLPQLQLSKAFLKITIFLYLPRYNIVATYFCLRLKLNIYLFLYKVYDKASKYKIKLLTTVLSLETGSYVKSDDSKQYLFRVWQTSDEGDYEGSYCLPLWRTDGAAAFTSSMLECAIQRTLARFIVMDYYIST